jgi:molybdopterin-binding protein
MQRLAPRPKFELRLEPDDSEPAYTQLERQVRVAVADGVLQPGDRLPSVRAVAHQLRLATNTVARAYAALAREGVLTTRPGGGSSVAPRQALDVPALLRQRSEQIEHLARDFTVRTLALGLEPGVAIQTLTREFTRRGRNVSRDSATVAPVDDEPALLSSRNQFRGTIVDNRCGEQIVEVRSRVREGSEGVAVVTRTSLERLGLQTGGPVVAHIKATEITLDSRPALQ